MSLKRENSNSLWTGHERTEDLQSSHFDGSEICQQTKLSEFSLKCE